MHKYLSEICEEYKEYIIALRRDFHKHPEAGWLEFRTTSKIAEILEDNNIEIHLGNSVINPCQVMGYPSEETINENIRRALKQGAKEKYIEAMEGYTGLMAIIDTGKEGPTVALRFDIDSNEVVESKEEDHRPFKEGFNSINEGFDHACGHDGHGAIGVVTAIILNKIKDNLTGKIKIFFQPAEEGVRGAKAMVETSNFDDVDYLLSAHIGFLAKEEGVMITNTKGFLATSKIDAYFKGKSAHAGAAPEQGKNALLAAASAALNIHAQCQDGRGICRVNVGYISAGTGRNVVPDTALMKIETRGESTEINESMYNKTLEVLKASAAMYGVEVETKLVGGAAGGEGDEELASVVRSVVEKLEIMREIKDTENLNGSEDVTYMMEKVQKHGGKATFMIIGTPISAPHHNGKFDFKEEVLVNGVKIFTKVVSKLLSKMETTDEKVVKLIR